MDETLAPHVILRNPAGLQSVVAGALKDTTAFHRLLRVNWVALAVDLPDVSSSLSELVDLVLASHKYSYIEPVLKLLVNNLKDVELCKPHASLKLAGRVFDSPTELKKEVYSILRAHSFGDDLQGPEHAMLFELFQHHPKALGKLADCRGITIGTHREGDQETRCFCIRTSVDELEEISYIKSVTALSNHQSQEQDARLLEKLQAAALVSVDLILTVLEESPMLRTVVVKMLVQAFPHMRIDLHVQKFYVANILALCGKDRSFENAMVRAIVGKIVRLDAERETGSAETLLEVLLRYLQVNLRDELFEIVLDTFEELVLPTFHTSCVQVAVLFCCQEGRAEYLEKFASLLVSHLYQHSHVQAATAYLTSLLAHFDSHILLPAAEMLLSFCLETPKGQHFVTAAKYVLYLLAARPSLLSNRSVRSKARKLLKSGTRFLERVPLHPETDYSHVLSLLPSHTEPVLEELYLPFSIDFRDMPLCRDYLHKTYSEDFSAKRRRGMSLDVSEPSSLKRRAHEVESCSSSLDTSTPTRTL